MLRKFKRWTFLSLCLMALAVTPGACDNDTPTPSPDMHDYCDRDPIPITCDQPIGPQQTQ